MPLANDSLGTNASRFDSSSCCRSETADRAQERANRGRALFHRPADSFDTRRDSSIPSPSGTWSWVASVLGTHHQPAGLRKGLAQPEKALFKSLQEAFRPLLESRVALLALFHGLFAPMRGLTVPSRGLNLEISPFQGRSANVFGRLAPRRASWVDIDPRRYVHSRKNCGPGGASNESK
jgi:hypothetical protein